MLSEWQEKEEETKGGKKSKERITWCQDKIPVGIEIKQTRMKRGCFKALNQIKKRWPTSSNEELMAINCVLRCCSSSWILERNLSRFLLLLFPSWLIEPRSANFFIPSSPIIDPRSLSARSCCKEVKNIPWRQIKDDEESQIRITAGSEKGKQKERFVRLET